MLKSILCNYSDIYKLRQRTVSVVNTTFKPTTKNCNIEKVTDWVNKIKEGKR